jgi:aldose 1-epimerase
LECFSTDDLDRAARRPRLARLSESAPLPSSPCGEQIEIAYGEQRAVVVEVGAGLRSYEAAGRPILAGYGPDELAPAGHGQLLIPWPNRIEDGSYEFGGAHHQLPLDEPERRNAIHGLVRWLPWRLAERKPSAVVMALLLYPRPGYPFTLELDVEYSLSAAGLAVRTRARNVGANVAPYGSGAHPYLAAGPGGVDTAKLRLPARTVVLADGRGLPGGAVPVAEAELDFRAGRPIGRTKLDHAFTDLERDANGHARVELVVEGRRTILWADESHPYLMVFTGDTLADGARQSVAVEPMTCAPNAFRSGDGLVRLAPGETHSAAWGIEH